MKKQGGNFLLQALLALSLVVAFMPFLTKKLATRDKDMQMHAVTGQIETATTVSRIYIRENLRDFNYTTITLSGDDFVDTLEPYGLPLGFIPRTMFDQKIRLVINKNEQEPFAYLQLIGGNMSKVARAELVRRVGFYASTSGNDILVKIPLDEDYSDIVRRKEPNPDKDSFLSDLSLGGFDLENGNALFARNGDFESFQTNSLSIFGNEDGRKIRSKIENLTATKTVFQNKTGEASLALTRGILNAGNISAKTISKFGETGSLKAGTASGFDFSMTSGSSSFSGPNKWEVKGNMISDKITLNVERLEVTSFINASRGQDVFINPESLEYNAKSGISVNTIHAGNITLRDQTSTSLASGESGAVILDIRVAGTSLLPDVLVSDINNDSFAILANPAEDSSDTITCADVIKGLEGKYNKNSLSQNLICQYVFWQRLEKRIDIKNCMLSGKSECK